MACCPRWSSCPEHPWFIGVQFHPELKSKPFDPHPLFTSFIEAAVRAVAAGVALRAELQAIVLQRPLTVIPARSAIPAARHGSLHLHRTERRTAFAEATNLCYKYAMNAVPPTQPRHIAIGNLTIGNDRPLALIAGPCALESRAHAMEMCQALVEMTAKLGHRAHLQDLLRQGQPHLHRRRARDGHGEGAAHHGGAARALRRAGADRCAYGRAMRARRRGGGRAADPGLPLPADRSARRRRPRPGGR